MKTPVWLGVAPILHSHFSFFFVPPSFPAVLTLNSILLSILLV